MLSTSTTEAHVGSCPDPDVAEAFKYPLPSHCSGAILASAPGTTSTITTFSIVLDAEHVAKSVALSSW